ncbi:photosystem I reaction center subunit II, chloroplastic [Lycium barbarum]|uniref:photosystem I reaction center subunit II, chloroplastic n=1 Tax=Lycium barbarum TaxID=112863 RepID=UPI00293F1907|nr:photosystem I reaction center subunit II, chloroplastic [Lycium barbarum]
MRIKIRPSNWSVSEYPLSNILISTTRNGTLFSPTLYSAQILVHHPPKFPNPNSSMAMATQASLFTPALSAPKSSAPWKQSLASFSPKNLKSTVAVTRPIRAMAEEAAAAPAAATKEEKPAPAGFTPPQLDPNTPSPIFGGSTGGLLRKAQVEEFYVITWESPKEQIFEMPTGGAAIMREGPNLLKLARKEQCLALGTRLRTKYKINYQFYRVFPNGEVQYLHPKDGVYPEKVNAGRQGVGQNFRSIGKNVSPIEVKFTGKQPYDL